jgi:hypothetical protein
MTITHDDTIDDLSGRTDLSLDEALSAAVLGYRVTCDILPAGSYVHYEFNGWRHEFSHNGRIGSSSAWTPDDRFKDVPWRVFELKPPVVDKWGQAIGRGNREAPSDPPVIVFYESNPGDRTPNKWGKHG